MTRRIIIAALLLAGCVARAGTDDEWDTAIGQTEQVTKGLVAYWAMRNSGTTVFDEYGANNGTAINGVTFGTEHAAVGFGASFDGTNDYVDCNNPAALDIAGAITVSLWLRVASTNVLHPLIGSHDGVGSVHEASYSMYTRTTAGAMIAFRQNKAGTEYALVGGTLTPNLWHHAVGVFDGGTTITIYLDGALVNSGGTAQTRTRTFSGVKLGKISSIGNGYVNGQIDEVRIYNVALTADEVKQLYRMGALPRGLK